MSLPDNSTARLAKLRRRYAAKKSSALLLVLASLVLISVLIVAFFIAISTERQSAQFYANSSSVKLLADSTVDIVMGQIKDATRGTDTAGNTLAWASQPGMIRIYNTSGQAAGYYKLYSWTNMIGTTSFNPTDPAETPPTSWTNSPALYTDLNDPVSGVYPIVDPSATNSVIGFSISGAPTSSRDAAPMPVQWLYVLKDGSLAVATGSAGNTATIAAATASNPIVARIAFWADDDTSKINLNTAAGDAWTNSVTPTNAPAFWDTPRINGTFERTFYALNQPTHGEFQRYPGHPATTFLSAVFPNMTTNNLFAIVPRVNGGGSNGGSLSITNASPITQKTDRLYASVDELMFSTNMSGATNRIENKLGAIAFSNTQVQSAKFFLTTHSRAPEVNLYNQPRIVAWPINETNSPSCRTASDSLIAFCGSLVCTNAITGTINTNAYYFQRASSIDPVNDLPVTALATGVGRNRSLINYLRNLTATPVPGFSTNGESFASKYGPQNATPNDRDQILTEIFDYTRAINEQDSSSSVMTNSFTPTTNGYVVNVDTMTPLQSGQITPIYDSVNKTRGFGRFPTVIEADLIVYGIGQNTGSQTNYPPYARNNFQYTSPSAGTQTETWVPASANYSSYAASGGTATNCASGQTRIQPALLCNFFDPSMGFSSVRQNFSIEYDGLSTFKWSADGGTTTYPMFTQDSTTNMVLGGFNLNGGYIGMKNSVDAGNTDTEMHNQASGYISQGFTPQGTWGYPTYGIPLDIYTVPTKQSQRWVFNGGTLTVVIRAQSSNSQYASTPGTVLQRINITFPKPSSATGAWTPPSLAPYVTDYQYTNSPVSSDFRDIDQRFSRVGVTTKAAWITDRDVVRSMVLDASKVDARMIAAMTNVPASAGYFTPGPYYDSTTVTVGGHGVVENASTPYLGTYYGNLVPGVNYASGTPAYASILTNQIASGSLSGCLTNGLSYVGTMTNYYEQSTSLYNQYTNSALTVQQPYAVGDSSTNGIRVSSSIPVVFNTTASPVNAQGANGVFAGGGTSSSAPPGDWDTGNATQPDGAYINKADEGDDTAQVSGANGGLPYFTQPIYNNYLINGNFFTPNRQMPSPVMFGSLSTGVISQKPWQTLLFRPDPGGAPQHMGAQSPADYLLLDLFNMPVIEPYPISDPFSTAGKVNMNYQIVPFTYITRSTAVQAVLRSEQMLAIPTSDGTTYKASSATPNRRYYIDLNATLTQFSNMFSTGKPDGSGSAPDIFRSAAQICSLWLIPSGTPAGALTYSSMQAFWKASGINGGALTGDNVRERPYADLYPRLTTKSNTFTVHYRVETLKKLNTTAVNQWVEGTDIVTGEYRGSSTLERYLDTSDQSIPDYATAANPASIDTYYKFRVIETKQFTP